MTDAADNGLRHNRWKHRPKVAPLPRDEAARQVAITRLAFLELGRDEAIAFLNTSHVELGGRPLDLATNSDDGRLKVEAEIGRLAGADRGAQP